VVIQVTFWGWSPSFASYWVFHMRLVLARASIGELVVVTILERLISLWADEWCALSISVFVAFEGISRRVVGWI
jgi:hypothetical protein